MTCRWTILLTALAALASLCGPLPALFAFDRSGVGEHWWTVLTGHFTHWSPSHLFWDALMFAVLAAVIERRSRSKMLACVVSSALGITGAIAFLQPEVETYRGLSGVDSALFILAVAMLMREARRDREHARVALLALVTFGFVAKIAFEVATGQTVFVDSTDFLPLPLAHAVGAAVGAMFALPGLRISRARRSGSPDSTTSARRDRDHGPWDRALTATPWPTEGGPAEPAASDR